MHKQASTINRLWVKVLEVKKEKKCKYLPLVAIRK